MLVASTDALVILALLLVAVGSGTVAARVFMAASRPSPTTAETTRKTD